MDNIIEDYQKSEEALVPVLQRANEIFNYLPEPILKYTAEKLNMPLSAVCRIATFYKIFSLEPRGKHIISVCLGTACHVKGAGKVTSAIQEKLGIKKGGTTPDMLFTLEAVRCIGCCGLAPVLKVNEDIHGLMSKTKVPELLGMYK
ncbi:MAG: NAD(P)H-dependent oxidoreductase subunit E [Candidatus Aminicenantes bacterium]|nr:MAG: NAD(P)H-dependent oxidoreductase subunit E [Candidatus Aminicenantes bacterium]